MARRGIGSLTRRRGFSPRRLSSSAFVIIFFPMDLEILRRLVAIVAGNTVHHGGNFAMTETINDVRLPNPGRLERGSGGHDKQHPQGSYLGVLGLEMGDGCPHFLWAAASRDAALDSRLRGDGFTLLPFALAVRPLPFGGAEPGGYPALAGRADRTRSYCHGWLGHRCGWRDGCGRRRGRRGRYRRCDSPVALAPQDAGHKAARLIRLASVRSVPSRSRSAERCAAPTPWRRRNSGILASSSSSCWPTGSRCAPFARVTGGVNGIPIRRAMSGAYTAPSGHHGGGSAGHVSGSAPPSGLSVTSSVTAGAHEAFASFWDGIWSPGVRVSPMFAAVLSRRLLADSLVRSVRTRILSQKCHRLRASGFAGVHGVPP